MKLIRLVYLVYVVALACAHMAVALSQWTGLGPGSAATHVIVAPFVALLGAWVLAVAVDLVMGEMNFLSLSFAGLAVVNIVSLATLVVLHGAAYLVFAFVPPLVVLVRAAKETFVGLKELRHV